MISIRMVKLLVKAKLENIKRRVSKLQAKDNNNKKIVKGKILIIWDDLNPEQKRNSIDTDQITPIEFCISKSLENIDEYWKKGAFYYLIPDFKQKIKDGYIFLVVGDRFGIGSSREMSPAGIKALAEELNKELFIVCGNFVGEIFRRNSLNIGLEVIECPNAVKDANNNQVFEFNKETRILKNLTLKKSYIPKPLNEKEEYIRRSKGIFNIGRTEYISSLKRKIKIEWPNINERKKLSLTEQIIWAHRVDKKAAVKPNQTLRIYGDLFMASDGSAPLGIYTFNKITGGDTIYPRNVAIILDHFVFSDNNSHRKQLGICKEFAEKYHINKPYFFEPGHGIYHYVWPENGLIVPGGIYPSADSHSLTYGAYGALGIGIGSTTLGFGWSTGYIYLTLKEQCEIIFHGSLNQWTTGKDVALFLLKRYKNQIVAKRGIEFFDSDGGLSISDRHTIANMMAEAESISAIFIPDEIMLEWFKKNGFTLKYPVIQPGESAEYVFSDKINLSEIGPMVAKPFKPNNSYLVSDICKERLKINKAIIGSCTNSSYEDLLQAAYVYYCAYIKGIHSIHPHTELLVYPGSSVIKNKIMKVESRLGEHSIYEIFQKVGAKIRESWCGPCIGLGVDALKEGQIAVTTFNRNWPHRTGYGGKTYLASPVVVAASSLTGYITSPIELGFI